jgi:hypothetical protein
VIKNNHFQFLVWVVLMVNLQKHLLNPVIFLRLQSITLLIVINYVIRCYLIHLLLLISILLLLITSTIPSSFFCFMAFSLLILVFLLILFLINFICWFLLSFIHLHQGLSWCLLYLNTMNLISLLKSILFSFFSCLKWKLIITINFKPFLIV